MGPEAVIAAIGLGTAIGAKGVQALWAIAKALGKFEAGIQAMLEHHDLRITHVEDKVEQHDERLRGGGL